MVVGEIMDGWDNDNAGGAGPRSFDYNRHRAIAIGFVD